MNWNFLEVIWSIIAVLGMKFSLDNIINGALDLKALGDLPNGRHIVAVGNIRRDAARFIIQTAYLGLGLYAGLALSGPAILEPIGATFIFTSLLLTASAFMDSRDRKALLKRTLAQHRRSGDVPDKS